MSSNAMSDITDAVLDAVLSSAGDDLSEMDQNYLDLLMEMPAETPDEESGDFLGDLREETPEEAGVLRMARRLGHGAAVDAWRYACRLEQALHYAWEKAGSAGTSKSGLELFKWIDTDGKQRPRVQHSEPGKGRGKKAEQPGGGGAGDANAEQPKPAKQPKQPRAKALKPDAQKMTQEIAAIDREQITPEHVAKYGEQLMKLTVPEIQAMRESLGLDPGKLKRPKKSDAIRRVLDHIEGKTPEVPAAQVAKDAVAKFRETGEGDLHEIAKSVMKMTPTEIRSLRDELQGEKGGRTKQDLADRVIAGLLADRIRGAFKPKTEPAKDEESGKTEPEAETPDNLQQAEPQQSTAEEQKGFLMKLLGGLKKAGSAAGKELYDQFYGIPAEMLSELFGGKKEGSSEVPGEEVPSEEVPSSEASPEATVKPEPETQPEPAKPEPEPEQAKPDEQAKPETPAFPEVPGGIEKLNTFTRGSYDKLIKHFGAEAAKDLLKQGYIAKTGDWLSGYKYAPTAKAHEVSRQYNTSDEQQQHAWREDEQRRALGIDMSGIPEIDPGAKPEAETSQEQESSKPAGQHDQNLQWLREQGPQKVFDDAWKHSEGAATPQRARRAIRLAVMAAGYNHITPQDIDRDFGPALDRMTDEAFSPGESPYDTITKTLSSYATNRLSGNPVDLDTIANLPAGGKKNAVVRERVQGFFSQIHRQSDILQAMAGNFQGNFQGNDKQGAARDAFTAHHELRKHAQSIADGLQIARDHGNENAYLEQVSNKYGLTPAKPKPGPSWIRRQLEQHLGLPPDFTPKPGRPRENNLGKQDASDYFPMLSRQQRRGLSRRFQRLSRRALHEGDLASARIYAKQAREMQQ